jgi:FKBP-type peptidyl-prolyl cis-trans isomerase
VHTCVFLSTDATVREAGVNLAVAKMRNGEKAVVYVTNPKYGYGEKGNFSFPSVPPNASLVYEIELVGWESVEEVSHKNIHQPVVPVILCACAS